MTRIVVEEDHFLKVLAVVLDPTTPDPHCRAVEEFFAHDEPDFPGWCRRLQKKIPGLYPAEIVFAADEDELTAQMANAEGAVVESLRVTAESLDAIDRGGSRRLAIVHKYGTITSNIDLAACQRSRGCGGDAASPGECRGGRAGIRADDRARQAHWGV